MKKICILTASRAEYGLLKPIIVKLKKIPEFETSIVVTGAHLSPEFGRTFEEILADGNQIDKKIDILLSSDMPSSITKSMGLAMISFADYFKDLKPDMLIVLGDRYETLAVCCAAMNERIPIAHIHGGETTEGAIDEMVRHAITKLSYLHFTSTEEYRHRVIQLGEQPNRVFTVGAMGVENALHTSLLSKEKLESQINFKLDRPYGVVTFHPVTLENQQAEAQTKELLKALNTFEDMKFIITMANADAEGQTINKLLDEYATTNSNVVLFKSLGMIRYLSAIKYSTVVIGNSSSGLIEVPSFKVPTVNIGDRQKGRIQSDSVINCDPVSSEIVTAIKRAGSDEFKKILETTINPYARVNTSEIIVDVLKQYLNGEIVNLKKKFYDVDFSEV